MKMNSFLNVRMYVLADDMKFSKKDDIVDLKKKLRSLKTELKGEMKKEEVRDVSFCFL